MRVTWYVGPKLESSFPYFAKNPVKIACFYNFLAENQFLPVLGYSVCTLWIFPKFGGRTNIMTL